MSLYLWVLHHFIIWRSRQSTTTTCFIIALLKFKYASFLFSPFLQAFFFSPFLRRLFLTPTYSSTHAYSHGHAYVKSYIIYYSSLKTQTLYANVHGGGTSPTWQPKVQQTVSATYSLRDVSVIDTLLGWLRVSGSDKIAVFSTAERRLLSICGWLSRHCLLFINLCYWPSQAVWGLNGGEYNSGTLLWR